MNASATKTLRLIGKCLRQAGAEDLYRSSFRDSLKARRSSSVGIHSTTSTHLTSRKLSANPMLNGVSMLQWFFDEVRPDQREVRYWMKYFSQATNSNEIFAVIQITEDVFIQEQKDQIAKSNDKMKRSILETLSLSLYFLQQNKMNVIVLVGSSMIGTEDTKMLRHKIYDNIKLLVNKLEESGTRSIPIFDGGQIFSADKRFRVQSVNTNNVDWLTSHGNIPVVGCVAENVDGYLNPILLEDGVHHLSTYTKPLKVIILNSYGGVLDEKGQKVTTVFLPGKAELLRFAEQPWWTRDTDKLFHRACDLLKVLPKKSSYVVTSAYDLLTELLTQRGYGTMFKKVVPVTQYTSLDNVLTVNGKDKYLRQVLPELVNSAFDKPTSNDYWESLPLRLQAVYLTDDLKSCAIVMNCPSLPDVYYLDKFAVSREERGNFNIEVLWQQLKHDYKSLFWRSRHNNIFNSWYEARSDGIIKLGYYHVFWYGMTAADINYIVKECQDLPSSFILSA